MVTITVVTVPAGGGGMLRCPAQSVGRKWAGQADSGGDNPDGLPVKLTTWYRPAGRAGGSLASPAGAHSGLVQHCSVILTATLSLNVRRLIHTFI